MKRFKQTDASLANRVFNLSQESITTDKPLRLNGSLETAYIYIYI